MQIWNAIMDIWMISSMLIMFFPAFQASKGKKMTWREFWFFLFGLYVAGMPFIYLASRY